MTEQPSEQNKRVSPTYSITIDQLGRPWYEVALSDPDASPRERLLAKLAYGNRIQLFSADDPDAMLFEVDTQTALQRGDTFTFSITAS